jgi:hypothetical protein
VRLDHLLQEVDADVKQLKPGDEVFGLSPAAWGEYAQAREDRLARKPAGGSFEDVGALPIAGLTALQALSLGLGPLPHTVATIASGFLRRRPVKCFIAKCTTEDLAFLTELLETGKIRTSSTGTTT